MNDALRLVPHADAQDAEPKPPVWDFSLSRQLQHGDRHFTLQVACRSQAERLVLFGPSGAGKSQTLKMIAGLAPPASGHVKVCGTTLFDSHATPRIDLTPQARRLAYVFQDYALFPHLTVQQNVAFALAPGWRNPPRHGQPHPEVDRWLHAFELDAVRHLYPEQLSGGQRQRTALARALVVHPRAILLDEPFAALDRALRNRLRAELIELQERLRIPMLVITHDDEDVDAMASEVVQIEGGQVVAHRDAPPSAAVRSLWKY